MPPEIPPVAETKVSLISRIPKRTQYLLTLLVVVLVLAIAYFVGVENYYRVAPLGTAEPLPQEEGTPYTPEVTPAQYTEVEALLARATIDCGWSVSEQATLETGVYTRTPETLAVCETLKGKSAAVLQNLALLSAYDLGGEGYVSFTHEGRAYIALVNANAVDNSATAMLSNVAQLVDTKTLSRIDITPTGNTAVVHLQGTSNAGAPFDRYLSMYTIRHSGAALGFEVTRTATGEFEQLVKFPFIYEGTLTQYGIQKRGSFRTSSLGQVSLRDGDRDLYMEQEQVRVAPLYHKQLCGVEDTYGDFSLYIPLLEGSGGLQLLVHIGDYASFAITSSLYGYAPSEWATVLATKSSAAFRSEVGTTVTKNASNSATMKTLGGTQVKVISPISHTDDPVCGTTVIHEYQAIKGSAVLSFIYRPQYGEPAADLSVIEQTIGRVLETFEMQ